MSAGGSLSAQSHQDAVDLADVWGPNAPTDRPPRILGLFAHPDDEVFCAGGTIAACTEAGADAAFVSLTRGEAGQIRDVAVATRRTLGEVRAAELGAAAACLGVPHVICLDLGDGHLDSQPMDRIVSEVRREIEDFQPDVVITFGPDGAFGHPDHVISCLATVEAIGTMSAPPRLLHARFPAREQLLVDVLVDWLTSHEERFIGTTAFGYALKLFADGTSMLGFAADHLDVAWYPAGSFVIEQGEYATELFCILSGSVVVMTEDETGRMHERFTYGAGCFVGEDGLASGLPRNAHVVAREDVTCLVLSPGPASRFAGRGAVASPPARRSTPAAPDHRPDHVTFSIDVRPTLTRKVGALSAHRSQYALEPELFPYSMLEQLLGTEHFALAEAGS